MICPRCRNFKIIHEDGIPVVCPECNGIEPSCCEGALGESLENPPDPLESEDDIGHRD